MHRRGRDAADSPLASNGSQSFLRRRPRAVRIACPWHSWGVAGARAGSRRFGGRNSATGTFGVESKSRRRCVQRCRPVGVIPSVSRCLFSPCLFSLAGGGPLLSVDIFRGGIEDNFPPAPSLARSLARSRKPGHPNDTTDWKGCHPDHRKARRQEGRHRQELRRRARLPHVRARAGVRSLQGAPPRDQEADQGEAGEIGRAHV